MSWGPESPSLWLTRPLGYWEAQLMDWPPTKLGPPRCTCASLTHIVTDKQIDLGLWVEALRLTVHQEPHLRTDVNLGIDPPVWIPASDFTQVFTFRDLRDQAEGFGGVAGVWQLLEDQANHPWDYGSGHPLYRHLLWRVAGGYFAVHCYHHASGDGSTGLLAMKGIFERYAKLVDGEKVGETSLTPMESVEAITSSVNLDDGKAKVEKLLAAKVERGKNFKTIVPFSIKEMEMVNRQPLPLNRTLWREGTPANYQAIRACCRTEGVTVGGLSLAASYMAQAALVVKTSPTTPLPPLLCDIPVNVRQHLDPPVGDQYCGLYITEVTTKADLGKSTHLWDLARSLTAQLKQRLAEGEHIAFCAAKEAFETGSETSDLAASVAPEQVLDLLYSNMRLVPFPLQQSWGAKVRAVHIAGSYWAPGFANYLLLLQATDIFTYNMTHCPGPENTATAASLLDIIVSLVERAADDNPTLLEVAENL